VRVATDRDSGRTASITLSAAGPAGDPLRANLALMAPGTALRDGLERILRGRTGALIVLGNDKVVESICTGGFPLDVEFSATSCARWMARWCCPATAPGSSGPACT
jgi:hypothetical protein